MAWTLDLPSGVFKDFTLSSAIRREAAFDTQTMQFLRPEQGYGKGKGQSITITRFRRLAHLTTGVADTDELPSGRPAIDTKAITVTEWGFKIPMTEFEKNLSFIDLMNPFQAALRDQMAETMEVMATTAMKLTPTKYTPALAGATISTSGTPGALSDKNLDVSDLRTIRDYMRNTKVPYFRGGKYIGILSTRAARGIKNDPEYKDWLAPNSSEPIMNGQLKDIEGFSLFESNFPSAYADLAGSSTVCGEALFFGQDPAILAVVDNPELRASPITTDLGRFREVGWVGTIQAGLTWDVASLARVIHVSST